MTRYTADSRDRVRDAVDMVALVSSKVELRRAGVNSHFGRCPFHDERTASFHVSPDEKLYHCFGCSESGDPFDFVMQTEGLDFKGALESLADRFGVVLQTEQEDPAAAAARERRERLYTLLSRAATFYERFLWDAREAAPARDYLLGRGLEEGVLRDFRVGYAPRTWERLIDVSRKAGFSDEELLAAGLAQRKRDRPGELIDRFRGRIMFPSADARGRVRGFGARTMGHDRGPKYLNTSDSELYHKREVLYGIPLARGAAAKAGRMILVEGYTDVIALHQAGVRHAVGIMGTSLTREQVAELVRLVKVVELALDADRAGQEAMLRAAELASATGLELRVVPLPPGADPGDMIGTDGAEALRERVSASIPFVAFEVERILAGADTSTAEGRDRAIAALAPALDRLPPSVLRDELTARAATHLDLSETRLTTLMDVITGAGEKAARSRATRPSRPAPRPVGEPQGAGADASAGAPTPPRDELGRSERTFLSLCVAQPGVAGGALAGVDELLTSDLARRVAAHLREHPEDPLAGLPSEDEALARAVADLVARAGRAGVVRAPQLEHARLVLELAHLDRALRRARSEHGDETAALAQRRESVRAAVREVVTRLDA